MTLAIDIPRSSLLGTIAVWAASEAVAKVARIAATMMAARVLFPAELGVVALVLATGEILKSITDSGVGQRIIAASDEDLEATCNTAQRIFWVLCSGLFVLSCGIAFCFDYFGDARETALLLVVFAAQFLFMPFGLVSCFRAMRNGRTRSVAAIAGGQIVFSAMLAVALLFFWPVAAAMILPRALTAPAWAIAMRRLSPWRPNHAAGFAPLRPFLTFGAAVIGVEVVKAVRMQADKLIIGSVLGLEALGIWFFAFNAGLGLATSFATAFGIALFPHLCAHRNGADRRQALSGALRLALCVIVPIIVIQSAMAPIYVPIIFGERWADVSDLVSVLCLAAAPAVVWTATSQWLRAEDRANTDLVASIGITTLTVVSLAIASSFGLTASVYTYLIASAVAQIGATLFILKTRS